LSKITNLHEPKLYKVCLSVNDVYELFVEASTESQARAVAADLAYDHSFEMIYRKRIRMDVNALSCDFITERSDWDEPPTEIH